MLKKNKIYFLFSLLSFNSILFAQTSAESVETKPHSEYIGDTVKKILDSITTDSNSTGQTPINIYIDDDADDDDIKTEEAKPAKFFSIKLYDEDVWDLMARAAFNFIIVFILVKLIYRSDKKNKNYAFSFYLFSIMIFFLCYLLQNIKLELGFAFGLFAIFSILRYRTISIPMKEMTYLFLTIAIAVINALTTSKVSLIEILFTNFSLLAVAYFLETLWYKEGLSEQIIEYEKIENIKPENRAIMLQDLKDRTGLEIRTFEIMTTDFLRDMARIKIYYKDKKTQNPDDPFDADDDDDD